MALDAGLREERRVAAMHLAQRVAYEARGVVHRVDAPDADCVIGARGRERLAIGHDRQTADLTDKIATLRDQLAEYRMRSGELHAQLVTLRAVKTGGELMQTLRSRLAEVSDRIQRATIEIVDTQEQLMLARVKLQNQLADLKLGDATRAAAKR